jgi:ABC-type dipeptide/oligopeptide/nickel transport system permease component
MQRYLVRRLLQMLPTLLLASMVVFMIINLAPGDPAAMMLGTEATDEELALERARLGLDRPLPVRYVIWLSDVVRGRLGSSMTLRLPVTTLIANALPNTLRLTLTVMSLSVVIGSTLGLFSALKQNSRLDTLITGASAVALSIPSFWLGILLILVFSVRLRWLPPSGARDPSGNALSNLRYLVLPTLSLMSASTAYQARWVRTCVIDVMASDYIRTARAKGLRERVVIARHALRNVMIPIVTVMGMQFGGMLGGAVVTESVFAYQGIGRLTIRSISFRDYPVVQGTLIFVAIVYLFTNMVVDLLYGFLDPRVRLE